MALEAFHYYHQLNQLFECTVYPSEDRSEFIIIDNALTYFWSVSVILKFYHVRIYVSLALAP